MNEYFNFSDNWGKWYESIPKTKFDWKFIKDMYARNLPFYTDDSYKWISSGIKNSVDYKIRYLPHLKLIQIAFEASKSAFDWFINFLFFGIRKVKPYKDMPVEFKTHAGFTLCYKSIQEELRSKIEEICKINEVDSIDIFGRSYGGAMVQLCLEDLVYHYVEKREKPELFKNQIPIITGLTVGAPRVFYIPKHEKSWERIQTRFSRLIMVANVNDIFTYLPPSAFGAKHIVPLYGVGKGKHLSIFRIFNSNKYHDLNEYTKKINSQED